MKLTVVVIENAWENWSDPKVRDLFMKAIGLKQMGYGKEYPSSVISVDGTDFFASHHLVCKESESGDLVPLMGYRSVPFSRAKYFHYPFGGTALVRAANAPEHEASIANILEHAAWRRHEISYDSSWTILPEIRRDRELTGKLQEIMKAIHVLYHTTGGPQEVVAGAVMKFKMDRYYHYWGYGEIQNNGRKLPGLLHPFFEGAEIVVFHAQQFSTQAIADAERYRSMWEERIIVGTIKDRAELPKVA